MNANTTAPAASVEGVAVSAFGEHGEALIAERVAQYRAWNIDADYAVMAAEDHEFDGEYELGSWYREVARRLRDGGVDVSDEDADLVTVAAGSDAPPQVVREGVALGVDESQWRADNAVGLELGPRPLTVNPAAVETQAQFDARMARGYAEREARRPVTDPFRRLPVLDEAPF